ncbi:flagellar basal body P-ring protein FlgI [Campylobacter sp. 19-13652]|uniref:flagellar basal body P-ring protein FlgI n=1 Tax=Campylobacter sp. 19-13652 TaxID=2840180 RepID=UPI001C747BFB|nr:flagellar basal body P-ring protein FlgI [Campylobacter sp. 19-13652]BCX79754.1 flagellar P-ring protein [Campylobacter sp. 19-13652]
MRKLLCLAFMATLAFGAQIKELASILGVRQNQLIGYGLVVGLNGTGDGSSSEFTIQSISNMLQSMDVKVDPSSIKSKNAAAVVVTAKLPAFTRQGDTLDVSISSIGDAKNLSGGTLLMTPLKGVDGNIYAIAQGALSIGGRPSGRGSGNHPTVGSILGGAIVEREVAYDFAAQGGIVLSLNDTSFDTAVKIQDAINANISEDIAKAIDPKTVVIKSQFGDSLVEMANKILSLDVDYAPDEKIVIDERTGTIISGVNIAVAPVVLTHGDITVRIEPEGLESESVEGDIAVGDDAAISPASNSIKVAGKSASIASLTRALNKLGASPAAIIAIIENLKRVGAISASVEVM